MGSRFQMHHEPHQGCDIIRVQQPWHLLASATHQPGFIHLAEAACSENSPATTVPLMRPAPAFAVFPHLRARLRSSHLQHRERPRRRRQPVPNRGRACIPPAPASPARLRSSGEGLAEGSGPPLSPGAGGAKAQGLLEGPAGLGAPREGGTRGAGGGCGRLSVPRLGRPRSAEGPARPRGAHPATPGAAESPERLRRARTDPRGRCRGAEQSGRGSGAGPGTEPRGRRGAMRGKAMSDAGEERGDAGKARGDAWSDAGGGRGRCGAASPAAGGPGAVGRAHLPWHSCDPAGNCC